MKKLRCTITILAIIGACVAIGACGTDKQKLSAPQNIRAEQRMLVWDEVENASGYIVRIEHEEYETSANSYDLSYLYAPQTYDIKVLAVGDNVNNSDSDWSIYQYNAIKPVEHGYDESGLEYTLLDDKTGYEVSRGKHPLKGVVEFPDYYCTLPVKRIAEKAFFYITSSVAPNCWTEVLCNNVTTGLRFPAYLESIGRLACSYMIKLQEVEIPNSVYEMEQSAFEGCKNLKRVRLPKDLKIIPALCFSNCAIDEIIFPETLEEIGASAFACPPPPPYFHVPKGIVPTVSKLELPETVKIINSSAFVGWLNCKDIYFPKTLERLECRAFYDTAWYNAQADGFVFIDDILYEYKGKAESSTLEVPANVKRIAGRAFDSQYALSRVIINDGVTFMGSEVFKFCTALSEVRLPADLKIIPSHTFYSCKSLVRIELPDTVTEIGDYAFSGCSSLEEVNTPSALEVVAKHAFFGCDKLQNIPTVS